VLGITQIPVENIFLFMPRANIIAHVDPKSAIPQQCMYQSCQPGFRAGGERVQEAGMQDSVVCCGYISKQCACFQVLLKSIFNVLVCYAAPWSGLKPA